MTHSDIACPFSYKLDRLLKYEIHFESNGQPSFVLKESHNDQPPTCTKELHALMKDKATRKSICSVVLPMTHGVTNSSTYIVIDSLPELLQLQWVYSMRSPLMSTNETAIKGL